MTRPIRVLMSKPGVDGHWRGIVVVSRGLRDAGMEVIFGGFQSVDQIVESAIQEDVDIIGLSIHSGAHVVYTQRVVKLLEEKGVKNNFMILVGGVIPRVDIPKLKEIGASNVYGPGTIIKDVTDFIEETIKLK
jgi:methylmalonyl-CoA mutase C-terminal domain/subunit